MVHRRPEPPDFDRRVNRLVELQNLTKEQEREFDEIVLSLMIEDKAPTQTIAERLGIIPQSVSYLCRRALKRQGAAQGIRT